MTTKLEFTAIIENNRAIFYYFNLRGEVVFRHSSIEEVVFAQVISSTVEASEVEAYLKLFTTLKRKCDMLGFQVSIETLEACGRSVSQYLYSLSLPLQFVIRNTVNKQLLLFSNLRFIVLRMMHNNKPMGGE